jgi:hypothetical protein
MARVTSSAAQSPIIIPGLAGSPDIRANGAADNEFDDASGSSWTSYGTPTAVDENTTTKSHLFLTNTGNATDNTKGIILNAILGALPKTITFKGTGYSQIEGANSGIWFGVTDSATAAGNTVAGGVINNILRADKWTNFATLSGNSTTSHTHLWSAPFYVKIVVTSTSNVDVYTSYDGITWNGPTNFNPGFGGTRYVVIGAYTRGTGQYAVDFVRIV